MAPRREPSMRIEDLEEGSLRMSLSTGSESMRASKGPSSSMSSSGSSGSAWSGAHAHEEAAAGTELFIPLLQYPEGFAVYVSAGTVTELDTGKPSPPFTSHDFVVLQWTHDGTRDAHSLLLTPAKIRSRASRVSLAKQRIAPGVLGDGIVSLPSSPPSATLDALAADLRASGCMLRPAFSGRA